MRIFDAAFLNRLRRWEVYANHFVAYIFHTDEGRQIRGRFLKTLSWRSLLYFGCGLPIYGLLMLAGWAHLDWSGPMIAFLILDLDFAVGIAAIRTVGSYRHRVALLYRIDPVTGLPPEEEMPLTHRELGRANAPSMFPGEVVIQPMKEGEYDFLAAMKETESSARSPAPQAHQEEAFDATMVIECTVCHRRINPVDSEMARRIEHCIYCGGEVRRRHA